MAVTEMHGVFEHMAINRGRKGQHRTNRQVNAAGKDHQRHADRGDAEDALSPKRFMTTLPEKKP